VGKEEKGKKEQMIVMTIMIFNLLKPFTVTSFTLDITPPLSGCLDLPQPYGPPRPVTGLTLPFTARVVSLWSSVRN
jgi:hypothetical protein